MTGKARIAQPRARIHTGFLIIGKHGTFARIFAGNLKLAPQEEAPTVAFLKALSGGYTP